MTMRPLASGSTGMKAAAPSLVPSTSWIGIGAGSLSTGRTGKEIEDKRPLQRYVAESRRLLEVMETRLAGRQWIMDDEFTIADISMLGWVRNLIGFYDAGELVDYKALQHVPAWLERGLARPAVQRGLAIPKRG